MNLDLYASIEIIPKRKKRKKLEPTFTPIEFQNQLTFINEVINTLTPTGKFVQRRENKHHIIDENTEFF